MKSLLVEHSAGQRLDAYLVGFLTELSRAKIQSLIKSGDIQLNDAKTKPKQLITLGDRISINIPEDKPRQLVAQDIPLDVLYEDEHIIVINKAAGMVVHPAAGNDDGTLVNALLFHCGSQLAEGQEEGRPGIVHRLDKDTSGVMVCAKSQLALTSLLAQFADRTTAKRYLTVVQGQPNKPEDTVFTNIGRHPVNRQKMAVVDPGSGKSAITDYRVLYHHPSNTSLIKCDLHTGRTHQIRVHMCHIGTPILGDPIYANIKRQAVKTGRLMLHAWQLEIDHPETNMRLHFEAPVPAEYDRWIKEIQLD
ncbi:RluA family pseudouridine synthase [Persicirhabdus sediminis]|uniref:Pseudouridine synthase n=1 Tax=Persicirhabdus sediminis TaxID=454144 RepID=A0A8J7MD66_9BACT|nr:RluA family pseudouridine synthase [Persicirhabdus sediminis]MBK1790947.1 RluA family pseudouridine synthase [Persicirhabdus sediminis]